MSSMSAAQGEIPGINWLALILIKAEMIYKNKISNLQHVELF